MTARITGGGVLLGIVALETMAGSFDPQWLATVSNRHDLTLPAWGPYTKQYIGVSHVPATNNGVRFDLSVFPGLYRQKSAPPNVRFESGYHPWEAATDLSYYSHRHQVEWKDQVYADISFTRLDDQSRLIRAECVNNTSLSQNLELHLLASIHFPALREYGLERPLQPATVELPPGALCLHALDYADLQFAKLRPTDRLVYDGKWRGEIRADDFVNGSGLGDGFGATAGDTVRYEFVLEQPIPAATLLLRYRVKAGRTAVLCLGGLTNTSVAFAGADGLQTQSLRVGDLTAGRQSLTLTASGGTEIQLDTLVLAPSAAVGRVAYLRKVWNPKPEIMAGPRSGSLLLKYPDSEDYYGLAWDYETFTVREFLAGELDVLFQTAVNNHVKTVFRGDDQGHYTDVFLRPISLRPHTRRVLRGLVCNGTRAEVEQRLARMDLRAETCDPLYQAARGRRPSLRPSPAFAAYQFSQERMAATLACNVLYPVYTQRHFIKHYAPGRWWDSLYTWDAGFIGLGLLEVDERRAFECLNAYLTEPGAQSAFIHHGSMVPVQFYLFQELWNRTQSQALLEYAYPRLRQYYEFYLGRFGNSTMAKFKSGLLTPFDYFYNSGGWDDYPPQVFTQKNGLGAGMAPVVTTAHGIRMARIMTMAADALGRPEDQAVYQRDIAALSAALQQHAWDDAAGCFSYVRHDAAGQPVGQLMFAPGVNYNLGMDGVYPLVAGVGTPEQTEAMLSRLKSPDHLWSSAGLTAVDQSAPYYRCDGYWNGTVWMPHQWFFWKALLDLGEDEFAWQIARRALDIWRTEVAASYNCMEHFLVEGGRGAGWHQFGALSSPVLKWYAAYCRPGTLTGGFNVRVVQQRFTPENDGLEAELVIYPQETARKECAMVACLDPGATYEACWNGSVIPAREISPGLLHVRLPAHPMPGRFSVRRGGPSPEQP